MSWADLDKFAERVDKLLTEYEAEREVVDELVPLELLEQARAHLARWKP